MNGEKRAQWSQFYYAYVKRATITSGSEAMEQSADDVDGRHNMGVVASASLEARRTFIVYTLDMASVKSGTSDVYTQRAHFELHRRSDVPLDRVP